jgi:acyl-CoA thioesterase FadM
MAYELTCDGEVVATARTEHALVNGTGRPVRMPKDRRERLEAKLSASAP